MQRPFSTYSGNYTKTLPSWKLSADFPQPGHRHHLPTLRVRAVSRDATPIIVSQDGIELPADLDYAERPFSKSFTHLLLLHPCQSGTCLPLAHRTCRFCSMGCLHMSQLTCLAQTLCTQLDSSSSCSYYIKRQEKRKLFRLSFFLLLAWAQASMYCPVPKLTIENSCLIVWRIASSLTSSTSRSSPSSR